LFMPITIRISAPLPLERFYEREDEPLVHRQITDEIMYRLRELSGQDYVNRYAKRHQDVEPVEPAPAQVASGPEAYGGGVLAGAGAGVAGSR
jgi:hypothetical protein